MAAVMRRLLQPWAGVIGGAAGWFLSQQAGSDLVFARCGSAHGWIVVLLGILGLALAAAGGLLSWRVWREAEDAASGRRFAGLLGVLTAAVLAFPILLQVVAGLLVPGCGS
jgi:hypothetical protein